MKLLRRLRYLFRRKQSEAEMAEEMRYHLEQRAAEFADDGLPAAEAHLAAQRRFGNIASIQEQAREDRGWRWLELALKDLQLSARHLLRSPGFTLLAIITLGLGIGANTSMFSVMNTVMLKPVPYANSAQLDTFQRVTPQDPDGNFSAADFFDLRREAGRYGQVAAFSTADASLSEPGQPAEMARTARVTADFFGLLGVNPQLGRDFHAGEDQPGRDRLVILSQRTWRNRFGSRADIVGRTIRLDGEPHVIVGVLPASFNDWRHLGSIDLFRPLGLSQMQAGDRTATPLNLIGRRSGAVSSSDAAAFIASIGARLAADFPEANAKSSWRIVALNQAVAGNNGAETLGMLVGLSGFVMLIACSNLANFLLARTMARAREFALRAALGASRVQLLRPLLTEALLLALAGGICAVFVAQWAGDYLAMRSTGDNGEQVIFTMDWSVMGWAFGAALVTALAFGLAPALFALRLDLNNTLKSGARGSTGGRGHQRFRQFLIVSQFALAMILLTGAVLFIRGLDNLNKRRSGWESDRLVTGSMLLPAAKYSDAEKITAFHRLALERLQALPGVATASVSSFTPFFNWRDTRKLLVEGRQLPELGREPATVVNTVSPHYFATAGTRLLSGRAFREQDSASAPRVFIINQAMAKGLFGDENPIGRRLAQANGEKLQWGEIVGVTEDVVPSVAEPIPVAFQLYQPMAQEPRPRSEIAVRTAGAVPASLVDSIRAVMADLDPDLPIRKLQPADATVRRANYQLGVLRDMLASFGVLGLGLAALGIYGVIARTMAQRTSEFAIRLALGATARDITRLVLGSGVKQALLGSALGLLGAVGVARLLATGYPGMQLNSLPALLGTTLLLVTVALLACWLPARRAGQVDAMLALRAE